MICIIYSPWYWWNMVKVCMIRGFLMSVSLPSCHQYAPVLSPRKPRCSPVPWMTTGESPGKNGGYPNKSLDGLFHGKSQSKMDDWIVIPFYEGSKNPETSISIQYLIEGMHPNSATAASVARNGMFSLSAPQRYVGICGQIWVNRCTVKSRSSEVVCHLDCRI